MYISHIESTITGYRKIIIIIITTENMFLCTSVWVLIELLVERVWETTLYIYTINYILYAL